MKSIINITANAASAETAAYRATSRIACIEIVAKMGLKESAFPIPPAIPDAVDTIEFVSFCDISLRFCPMSGG
ncbi:MAG: hypothetical protein A2W93_06705 [Bacteroidetes bacterium GWF2_43_63]|nr:MAG: hypothetical protein A2W94_07830 [Bacteroidetes bacterium GWE2_42_42]OFY53309.1 MAG: hypothetical protein A2W93_06705 [Bacteroidetes bacterium GWF2_43_63]HBG71696.1 hypothetical protein [Bacteroidales bacterium]HCB61639.1 hypothetical protein [Bacteroidales bacterium]HCY22851.1 hypothetical protein [Bacteroidales bacterium]